MADVLESSEVEALYEVEPREFVAERNALARRLRDDGRRKEAAAVKKLRRPTLVAWALNQVARQRPEDVDDLLESGRAVRDAQAAALAGDGGDDALRDAAERRDRVATELAAAAAELAGEGYVDEAEQTLRTASVDDATADLLKRGRLTKEAPPAAGGFWVEGMPEPAPHRPKSKRQRGRAERLERALARAEDDVASAERAVTKAEERRTAAEAAVGEAREALDAARLRRADAKRSLDEATR